MTYQFDTSQTIKTQDYILGECGKIIVCANCSLWSRKSSEDTLCCLMFYILLVTVCVMSKIYCCLVLSRGGHEQYNIVISTWERERRKYDHFLSDTNTS